MRCSRQEPAGIIRWSKDELPANAEITQRYAKIRVGYAHSSSRAVADGLPPCRTGAGYELLTPSASCVCHAIAQQAGVVTVTASASVSTRPHRATSNPLARSRSRNWNTRTSANAPIPSHAFPIPTSTPGPTRSSRRARPSSLERGWGEVCAPQRFIDYLQSRSARRTGEGQR